MIHWRWFGANEPDARQTLSLWTAKRIWPNGERDLQWFGEQLCLGIFNDDEIIASMVYHNYEPQAGVIEISGAASSPRWLTKPVLREMYRYPFEEIGVQMIVQRTPAENQRLLGILARLGFEFHLIPRLRGRNSDEVVCTLTDDAWQANPTNRKVSNGKTRSTITA